MKIAFIGINELIFEKFRLLHHQIKINGNVALKKPTWKDTNV